MRAGVFRSSPLTASFLVAALLTACAKAPPSVGPSVAASFASAHPPSPSASAEASVRATVAEEPPSSPTAAALPGPPYDRGADVAARMADARRLLGPKAKTLVVEGVFVLAAPAGFELAGSADLIRRTLAAYFHERFGQRPSVALTVFLFPSAPPYDAFCRARFQEPCMSPYGFFHPEPRFIVMNAGPGLGTLTHELVHPIIETDFPRAPTWLNEGIASLFEAPVLPRPGEVHGVKNWRHPRLLAALGSRSERASVSLPALFSLSDDAFRDADESLHYVLARTFCLWLDNQGLLFPFYQRFRDHRDADPTGEKAFVAVVKKTPAEANEAFLAFARGL